MSQGIPEEIVDEIRQRTDLVSLINEYIKLERRGKNMVGLCPFHNEKTPSFSVSPDKQLYHCFGCGASGNVFSLIMQMENLTFPEAAHYLARKAGVTVPEKKAQTGVESLKDKIYRLNELAARFYAYHLHNSEGGKKAYNYLLKRGIKQEAIELFKLGYAPPGWTGFYNFALKKGAPPDLMVKSGLVSPGREKGYYDRFRDRVMFPIFNISGKIAGFGGRTMSEGDKSGPKYLNSPETPVFDKGNMLYGLNLAREEIRRQKKAIVTEGYTDVITAYQAGIKNCVASLGTALTAEQGRLLRNQADTVVTAYDSDTAGQAATWRGLAILQSTGCLVEVAEMPEGSDPDTFIRKNGPEKFHDLVSEALPLIKYRLQQLKKRHDLTSDKGRIDFIEELMPFLLTAVNQIEQDYYLKKAAEILDIEEDALRRELKKRRSYDKRKWKKEDLSKEIEPQKISLRPEEKNILSLMLQSKEIAEEGRNLLKLDYLDNSEAKKVIEEIWNLSAGELVFSIEKLLNKFEDQQIVSIISEAATNPEMQDITDQTANRMLSDSINKLHMLWINRKLKELEEKRKSYEARGMYNEANELLMKENELIKHKGSNPDLLGKGGDFNG